jgi:ubiquinone/menaquinone biosynthesis C-methylase UbiE
MRSDSASHADVVSGLFSDTSSYWDSVYGDGGVKGEIYSARQSRVVRWVVELAGSGASVIEIGTGAGHLAVDLATRGFDVLAVDASEGMLERTRKNAVQAGLDGRVRTLRADALDIPIADASFDVAVAVGLLPWVEDPRRALREMARLVRPGGYVLVTTDNRYGISRLLDPAWHPNARAAIRRFRRRLGQSPRRWNPGPVGYSWTKTRSLLASQGLRVIDRAGVGFGPFTFMFKQVMPESIGLALERNLQSLCDRPSSPLWRVSLFHAVASQKPASD